jgi:RNA polymerase sigma factor (sigma-70 family)
MKASILSHENLQAAVNGDIAAIEDLIVTCQPNLLKFAQGVCATPEDAEDAVQETLWIISQRIGTLRMLTAFIGWATRIVRHECYRLLRYARGESPLDPDLDLPYQDDFGQRFILQQDVTAALANLPHIYRQVIIMRDIEEMTAPEVASMLGIGVEAVKSRLHRARTMLRIQLYHWVEPV